MPLMVTRPKQRIRAVFAGLLIISTSVLVGFSEPPESSAIGFRSLSKTIISGASDSNTQALASNGVLSASARMARAVSSPQLRARSFTTERLLNPVIAGINAHVWFKSPSQSSSQSSANSSEDALQVHPIVRPLSLHGVGFPDIRTYKKPRRSPFAAPLPWSSMIAWRHDETGKTSSQPIARVRCMGLSPQAVALRAEQYEDLIRDTDNLARSHAGAQGLMQLMPDTANWLKVTDPHDPADNLQGGIKYLANLQERFETVELTLAAYNAGPGNVRRYGGVPPFAETQAYLQKVQAHYRRYNALSRFMNPGS